MNDAPTLSIYEEMADLEFQLENVELDEEAINQALMELYSA